MNETSRRTILKAAAGLSGVAVAGKVAASAGLIPPDSGGLYGAGETLTYAAQRLLTSHSKAREFSREMISRPPFPNETSPPGEAFRHLEAGGFADWKFAVDGMVARPLTLSLPEVKAFPRHSQITEIACEEGWSYIAEWIGTPLSEILKASGIRDGARWVVYRSIDKEWWDSVDMADAMHPQTLLAWGMNGYDLPVPFGGPLRVRVPRQLGYKSVKYITGLTVTDDLTKFGKGLGSASPEGGYSWYAGI